MNGWFEQIKKLYPEFPESFRGKDIDALTPLSGLTQHCFSPLGWIITRRDHTIRLPAIRALLGLGVDPGSICVVYNPDTHEQLYYCPLTFTFHEEDARLLLEAGAFVRLPSRDYLRKDTFNNEDVRQLVLRYYHDSLRATAVVWCCDGLRATSSWPDMAFLLTSIMMCVSK